MIWDALENAFMQLIILNMPYSISLFYFLFLTWWYIFITLHTYRDDDRAGEKSSSYYWRDIFSDRTRTEKERKNTYVQILAFTYLVNIQAERILSSQQNDDPSFHSTSVVSQRYGYGDRLSILKETAGTHHVRDETKVAHHRYFVIYCQGQQRYTSL
jgi:hypothetical protein